MHSTTPYTKISSALQTTFNIYKISNINTTEQFSAKICYWSEVPWGQTYLRIVEMTPVSPWEPSLARALVNVHLLQVDVNFDNTSENREKQPWTQLQK